MGKQSVLPDAYEEETIKDLSNGEEAYVVPWCVFADRRRRLWINTAYSFGVEPFGTQHTKIKRDGDTIQVYANTLGDYRFKPGNPCFVGSEESDFLPVELIE